MFHPKFKVGDIARFYLRTEKYRVEAVLIEEGSTLYRLENYGWVEDFKLLPAKPPYKEGDKVIYHGNLSRVFSITYDKKRRTWNYILTDSVSYIDERELKLYVELGLGSVVTVDDGYSGVVIKVIKKPSDNDKYIVLWNDGDATLERKGTVTCTGDVVDENEMKMVLKGTVDAIRA